MRSVYRPAPFVLVSTNHGTMVVNRNDYHMLEESAGIGVGHQLLNFQSFDQPEVDLALEILERRRAEYGDGVVAIDCGANIGVHTVEWARLMFSWGQVLAFEAQEKVYYALSANIILNNCLNVVAKNCAVGVECSQITIPAPNYFIPASYGSLELKGGEGSEYIGQSIDDMAVQVVDLISIDSLEMARLDFLKIDVEGMEVDVLAGAERTIRSCKPVMLIEIIKSNNDMIFDFLSKCGYLWLEIGNNIVCASENDRSLDGLVELGRDGMVGKCGENECQISQTHEGFPEMDWDIFSARWVQKNKKEWKTDASVVIRCSSVPSECDLGSQWIAPIETKCVLGGEINELNKAVETCKGKWVIILNEGDLCHASLVSSVIRAASSDDQLALIYFDEAQLGKDGEGGVNPHYKPDFNIDYLRSMPYLGATIAVNRDYFSHLGGYREAFAGIEEYDFALRVYEAYGFRSIGHLSGVLVNHKSGVTFTDRSLTEVLESGRLALMAHLSRSGISADVEHGRLPATYRVLYRHASKPLVSIVIPTKNQREILDRCIQSLFANTSWPSFEIIVVDNGSDELDAIEFLNGLRSLGAELDGRIRVIEYPETFNYSAMNNLGAQGALGEYLLLLNNDTQALHPEWLDAMMAHGQRPEVGVVGAKLLFPDGNVQHAGVVLGMRGPAEHPFIGCDAKDPGYYGRLQVDQGYSAVTGACMLVRRSLFESVGGLDEDQLAVSYSDIDLCLKVIERGYNIVWTPYAILMHEGSKSQKSNVEAVGSSIKIERFEREQEVMYRRWLTQMAVDPAYNRNLSLATTEFQFEPDMALRWDPQWRPAPRIISQPADRMGCGEYRIIAPTRALVDAGCIQGLESERIYSPPELARIAPDALILQRQIEPHQIEAIERHKRFNDVFCVFEIDDLITNAPVKNAHRKHLPKDIYKRLRRASGMCDRLVVATETLAEAYRDLNSDVRVIPNFIEQARWERGAPKRGVGHKPRVGWAGGVSHTGDLELIANVVEALKDEVEWVFFGMCPDRLRPHVHEFYEPVPLEQYADRLAGLNLDLAVAPLEDVPFNHAKSHLRLLEFGILGYPVVCSDLTPYRGDFPVTRVRNRFRDWADAIRDHIADLDATARQGDALREYVRNHWLLENNLNVWLGGWLP